MLTRGSRAALVAALSVTPAFAAAQQADTSGTAATRPDSAPPAPVAKPAPPAPAVVAGVGTIRVDGLLQAWYVTHTPTSMRTFRLRRAELKLSGDIAPRVSWTFSIDAAKALSVSPTYVTVDGKRVLADESVNLASQMLQDALVTVHAPRGIAVDVGQIKVPLSYVGTQSSSRLENVERPMFIVDRARGGSYGDVRDVGVLARGSATRHVDWFVGAFNGSGESQNGTDRNDAKAVAARVLVRGGVPGLQLGASGVFGGRATVDNPRRDRLGAEAQYVAGRLTVRSELMTGADGATHRAGGYALAAYRATRRLELVARGDTWDPDTRREDAPGTARARDVLGGANVALGATSTVLQADYGVRTFGAHGAPTTRQLRLNLQTAW